MIALLPPFSARFSRPALGALALLAALALPCAAWAQAPEDRDDKHFSDKVRDEIGKFGPLQEAKDWNGALALISGLQKISQPGTYDEFELAWLKGQLYLTIDPPQAASAIEPLETALRVSDQHHFFEDKDERKALKLLSQIYYGEGSAKGVAPAKQEEAFIKASDYLRQLVENERANHVINTEDVLFYAYLLLQRAQEHADKPDLALLKQAQKLSEEGLLLGVTPKFEFYRLLLSTLLAQNDYPAAADLLELLIKKDPTNKDNKDNWTQLCSIYLNLGTDTKDKQKSFDNNIRAIVTYERAQAAGFLKTPKDNFQLVSTYYNIGQVEQAARLLETDLKSGSIESDEKYWTYLAQWYQQVHLELKAIDALKEAAKHFPNSGEFDFMAAQNYYALEKFPEALKEAKLATAKGVGAKTSQAWAFQAYTAFELREFDEALAAANKALSYPESKKDAQLPGLKEAAERAIKDRNDQIEALKAKQKQ